MSSISRGCVAAVVPDPSQKTAPPFDLETIVEPELKLVLGLFLEMVQRPCEIWKEEPMREFIREYARTRNLPCMEDKITIEGPYKGKPGNIAVRIEGKGKGRDAKPVIAQWHCDMVIEPKDHDFTTSPMKLCDEMRLIDHDMKRVISSGGKTTIGADNRLAGCMSLALHDDPTVTDHPPIIVLVTWGEEKGLVGARDLDPALFQDATTVINMDHERANEVLNGCAGQLTTTTEFPLTRTDRMKDAVPVLITLDSMPTGHSGLLIHEDRGNALKELLEQYKMFLSSLGDHTIRLASIDGGSGRSTIPGTATMLVWGSPEEAKALKAHFNDIGLSAKTASKFPDGVKVKTGEPTFKAQTHGEGVNLKHVHDPLDRKSEFELLQFLRSVPHGVARWLGDRADKHPELSNNFGVIETHGTKLILTCMARHVDSNEASRHLLGHIESASQGLSVTPVTSEFSKSSGWIAGDSYPLLDHVIAAHRTVTGIAPQVVQVHAGIENGAFRDKRPDLQQTALWTPVHDAHSVHECFEVDATLTAYRILKALLVRLCEDKIQH